MKKFYQKKNVWIISAVVLVGLAMLWLWKGNMFSQGSLKLEIFGPAEVKAGEEVTYKVTYKNTGKFILEKPQLIFDLPLNSITENGKNFYIKNVEDLAPGQENSIEIKARLLGQEGDQKIATASISYTPKNLTSRFEVKSTFTAKIALVPIILDFELPSNIERGNKNEYSVHYSSQFDYTLQNVSIKVNPISGFFITESIPLSLDKAEWKISSLKKGEAGNIHIKGDVADDADKTMTFSASLGIWKNGNFIILKKVQQELGVTQSTVKPELMVNQDGLYTNSSFTNEGPNPPQTGKTTTYTIIWSIKNAASDQKNVIVKAILPEYVSLTGKMLPEDEASHVSFDASSREVSWLVGDISSKTGINGDPFSLQFQVSVTPKSGDSVIQIIGPASILGRDQLTNAISSFQSKALDTRDVSH